MDRAKAAKIAGMSAWQADPDGKREDSAKGGQTTLARYGRVHFVRLRERRRQLEGQKNNKAASES